MPSAPAAKTVTVGVVIAPDHSRIVLNIQLLRGPCPVEFAHCRCKGRPCFGLFATKLVTHHTVSSTLHLWEVYEGAMRELQFAEAFGSCRAQKGTRWAASGRKSCR